MSRALNSLLPVLTLLSLTLAVAAEDKPQAQDANRGLELFKSTIEPVLAKHCYECHSQAEGINEGGLELDSPAGVLRGGDTGPMIKPHAPEQSSLLRMLNHDGEVSAMPPEEQLPAEVIAAFTEWIRLGAPDSRENTGPTMKQQQMEESKAHWAFIPPEAVDAPSVTQSDWPLDPVIDQFILSAIEAEGMKPVNDANRRTLVRRVYFDLVGLPPTPEEAEAFINDESPNALEKLVDQLLASPRFGERWGRHWLDVVRYAESSGMEFNFTYPHAWPYRNYVIDAFNQDKPFDQFLKEQIAGDLLDSKSEETPAQLQARKVASSMLSFGPKRHNSGGIAFRMDVVDDQINTVSRATMGLTVSCARCHDHKFDPIPTADYYAMAGIFLSTEPLYGTIKQKYSNNPTDLLPIGPEAQARHAAAEEHQKKVAEVEKTLTAKKEEMKKATEAQKVANSKHEEIKNLLAMGVMANADASAQNTLPSQAEVDETATKLKEADELLKKLQAEVPELEKQVKQLKESSPERPQYAMTARDRAKPADTHIAIRGNYNDKGDVVPRGFLSAVQMEETPQIPAEHSGRLELAEWITSEQNPLTARVMVNRIWHHLFGKGIVPTVDNFGVIGKPPTHPELLDALTLQFIQNGWSTKQMIRQIMLSRTYQLSSTPDATNMEIDPNNRLLWRATPRRLEAEAIRDAVLAVSGQLDLERTVGSTVTGLGDKLVRGIATDKIQPASNHRSVHLPVVRDYVPEIFDLFDFPSPSLVSGRRSITNVPSQALYLRNSKFIAEQAQHAAERLLKTEQAVDDASRIDLAMRWSLSRPASAEEQAAALQLIEQIRQSRTEEEEVQTVETKAWTAWFQTLFMTAEFRFLVDAT